MADWPKDCLYARLGLEPQASAGEVKSAYRALASRAHPDVGGSNEDMVYLNEAHLVLSDPQSKRSYDLWRRFTAQTSPANPTEDPLGQIQSILDEIQEASGGDAYMEVLLGEARQHLDDLRRTLEEMEPNY